MAQGMDAPVINVADFRDEFLEALEDEDSGLTAVECDLRQVGGLSSISFILSSYLLLSSLSPPFFCNNIFIVIDLTRNLPFPILFL
jgi:hypothetical protein